MLRNLLYSIFRTFPIRKRRVLFISYYGKSYGCNPKYISEYLMTKRPNNADIYWAFINPEKYSELPIKKVRYSSIKYLYLLATSRVICTNYRMTLSFKKRRGQTYFQTWHSSLRLKMIEADTESSLPAYYIKMAKHDSAQTDYVVAGCEMSASTFSNSFWYNGKILRSGTPRNDLMFGSHPTYRNNVLNKLNIKENKHVILYAPTFREDKQLHYYDIDFKLLQEHLATRFGGDWIIVKRLHPHLSGKSVLKEYNIVDATDYDDIQELLSIADVLITDYSSLMFDFAISSRPLFLYIKDLDEYCSKERKLYFKIEELPFPLARTNSELMHAIDHFSETEYVQKLSHFNKSVKTYENGTASKTIGDLIIKLINR